MLCVSFILFLEMLYMYRALLLFFWNTWLSLATFKILSLSLLWEIWLWGALIQLSFFFCDWCLLNTLDLWIYGFVKFGNTAVIFCSNVFSIPTNTSFAMSNYTYSRLAEVIPELSDALFLLIIFSVFNFRKFL